jgi:hypothetical protein
VARPVLLTPDTSWGAEEALDPPPGDDVFDRYPPPFDLEADMLFAVAPGPLPVWFARITRGRDGSGRVEEGPLYHELNVMAPGRDGAFFVPAIWATSRRSVRIAWRYGMPKAPIAMTFGEHDGVVESRADGSFARARLLPGGRLLGALADALLPVWSPVVRFPSGDSLRAQVRAAPRVHAALVAGRLAVGEPWLPRPVRLLPLGLYARGVLMRLPPPPRPMFPER